MATHKGDSYSPREIRLMAKARQETLEKLGPDKKLICALPIACERLGISFMALFEKCLEVIREGDAAAALMETDPRDR